jgi:hypothetical protein
MKAIKEGTKDSLPAIIERVAFFDASEARDVD